MIKAVVFDFDGLMVDTESAWYQAYRRALAGMGCDLPLSVFARVIGTSNEELHKFVIEQLGPEADLALMQTGARSAFDELMAAPELREGVVAYLDEARELGLKVGLATSSTREWVERYLKQFSLLDRFDVIRTRDEVTMIKPNPELYSSAVQLLGVKPEEALAFEDSLNGLRAALAAGLHCVIVPNEVTAGLAFEGHAHRLSSMKELSLRELIHRIIT